MLCKVEYLTSILTKLNLTMRYLKDGGKFILFIYFIHTPDQGQTPNKPAFVNFPMRTNMFTANLCGKHVLQTCFANMQCKHVLQTCIANMYCKLVLQICTANMYCKHVLQTCTANMYCKHVLLTCTAIM